MGRSDSTPESTDRFPLVFDAIHDRLNPSLRIRSRSKASTVLITPAEGKPIRLAPDATEDQKTYVTPVDAKGSQPMLVELEDEQHNLFVSAQPLESRLGPKTRTQWLIKGYPKA